MFNSNVSFGEHANYPLSNALNKDEESKSQPVVSQMQQMLDENGSLTIAQIKNFCDLMFPTKARKFEQTQRKNKKDFK